MKKRKYFSVVFRVIDRDRMPVILEVTEVSDEHLLAGPTPIALYTQVVDGLCKQFRPPVGGGLDRQHFDLCRVGIEVILAAMPQVQSAGARVIIADLHEAQVAGLRERLERTDRM